MNDDEIAAKLAEAMGWVKGEDKGMGYWGNPDTPNKIRYAVDYRNWWNSLYIQVWEPSKRWDHVGIVIDWMESQDKLLWIDYKIHKDTWRFKDGHMVSTADRFLWFSGGSDIYFTGPLTPRHICLAALESL